MPERGDVYRDLKDYLLRQAWDDWCVDIACCTDGELAAFMSREDLTPEMRSYVHREHQGRIEVRSWASSPS